MAEKGVILAGGYNGLTICVLTDGRCSMADDRGNTQRKTVIGHRPSNIGHRTSAIDIDLDYELLAKTRIILQKNLS